jgi:hypothetical protein
MGWFAVGSHPYDRRRRAEIDETVARNRRASAELLLLVEQVRSQISDLDRNITDYFATKAGGDYDREL